MDIVHRGTVHKDIADKDTARRDFHCNKDTEGKGTECSDIAYWDTEYSDIGYWDTDCNNSGCSSDNSDELY